MTRQVLMFQGGGQFLNFGILQKRFGSTPQRIPLAKQGPDALGRFHSCPKNLNIFLHFLAAMNSGHLPAGDDDVFRLGNVHA